jgi:putative hydrolase of the HAD superfamily
MMIKATFWDFGGVLTTSPFEAFNRYERANDLPLDFIRMNNAKDPDTNAWARFERSEITIEEFDTVFEEETAKAGHPVKGLVVLNMLGGDLRPEMVEALRICNDHFETACLTNNMIESDETDMTIYGDRERAILEVMGMFDHVIESSKVGIRKPDPRFYEMACDMVKVAPGEVVFLDDLGINLKPARVMGMATIKVTDPAKALKELEAIVGIPLK